MATLPDAIGDAAVLFAGTNIDDLAVLAVLSASSRATGRPRRWEIWAGQYAGTGVLVAVSLAAARGLDLIPNGWLWTLGLLPLALGAWKLAVAVRAHRRGEPAPVASPGGLPNVNTRSRANLVLEHTANPAPGTPVLERLKGFGPSTFCMATARHGAGTR